MSLKGIDNLLIFARLLGYISYFHPFETVIFEKAPEFKRRGYLIYQLCS